MIPALSHQGNFGFAGVVASSIAVDESTPPSMIGLRVIGSGFVVRQLNARHGRSL
jgi:hypothetical protein